MMRLSRTKVGVGITTLWIVYSISLYLSEEHPTKLNEWGDFYAGIFAPLAFLWLVLGYLQQGEELANSREALLLQAAELNNSVKQQEKMVHVAQEQLLHERKSFELTRESERRSRLPSLIFSESNIVRSGNDFAYYFMVVNNGGTATDLKVCSFKNGRVFTKIPVFKKGESKRFQLSGDGNGFAFHVVYLDEFNEEHDITVDISGDGKVVRQAEAHEEDE